VLKAREKERHTMTIPYKLKKMMPIIGKNVHTDAVDILIC
jgi:hypothetical protein